MMFSGKKFIGRIMKFDLTFPNTKEINIVDGDLTLEGLRIIYEKNKE